MMDLDQARAELEAASIPDQSAAEKFRVKFLGSKGILKQLFGRMRLLPATERKSYGRDLNQFKGEVEEMLTSAIQQFGTGSIGGEKDKDLTLPAGIYPIGSRHPLSIIRRLIVNTFRRMSFEVIDGPEIEDDWHNFSALNIPADHPARDMQDTFFITHNPDTVLRTHTSPAQIRVMERQKPPIRVISPGRVYRCDHDATHSPVFHQVEGLYIAEGVSFGELKYTLYHFVKEIFGVDIKLRMRPSFFPFTEPSAELDIEWSRDGKSSWMEILGCGMVDPAVLENCKIDPHRYSGYAFGMGVERIAMLKYGIPDIRLFYENDIRFLRQFSSAL